MIYVYSIKSVYYNYLYVGMTNNISRRYNEHNSGYERTTKPYLPFNLIYFEKCSNREEERKREKYLKSGIEKEFLKSIDHIIDPVTLTII